MWKILNGDAVETFAAQLAVVPAPLPAQLHVQGPFPETTDAVPTLQRLAVGAALKVWPLEEPHTPFNAPLPTVTEPDTSRSLAVVLAVSKESPASSEDSKLS